MGKCVTSAPCGNCFAMKNPNPTKDEKASGNSPVLKLANALKDSSKCNFVSKEKMLLQYYRERYKRSCIDFAAAHKKCCP